MTTARRRLARQQRTGDKAVERYAQMLAATGMDEREVARGYYYAAKFGIEALSAAKESQCVVFAEPTCGDWNCIAPDHQRLEYPESPTKVDKARLT